MASAIELLFLACAVGTLGVAAVLVALARRSVSAILLATFLAAWSAGGLGGWAAGALGGSPGLAFKVSWAASCFIPVGMAGFGLVYPNVGLTRARRLALVALVAAGALGAAWILAQPDAIYWDDGGPTRMLPILGTTVNAAAYPLAIALLGWRWLRSPASPYRTMVAWGAIPIAWWTLHDGLGYSVYPWILRGEVPGAALPPHPILQILSWIVVASVAFTLFLMLVALARTLRGRGASDDRALAFVLLYALPVTLVQLLDPSDRAQWHILLDYAIVPLAVYGVLRHRIVDIDLKLKRGLQGSTVAAAFLAVFLVVGTIAQELLADRLGWLAGGAAAGALVLAIAPLQRAAEKLSTAALPHAKDDAGYLTYRRYQIYRVALEGSLRDGVVDPAETSALRSLRDELGLTLDDHRALEAEARARFAARPS